MLLSNLEIADANKALDNLSGERKRLIASEYEQWEGLFGPWKGCKDINIVIQLFYNNNN